MSLQCGLIDGTQLTWDLSPDDNNIFVDVADSLNGVYPRFQDKFSLTNEGNTYTLTVLNAEFTDGTQYRCRSHISNINAYAEVIVVYFWYIK